MGMVIDLRRCTGCHSCAVACKEENNVPPGIYLTRVVTIGPLGDFPHLRMSYKPLMCMHCGDAPCAKACRVGAARKRQDGIVLIDPDQCDGCRECVGACPYHACVLNEEKGFAQKCDFCSHRIDEGREPRCVQTCPNGARRFGDISDPESDAGKLMRSAGTVVLKPKRASRPSVFYIEEGAP